MIFLSWLLTSFLWFRIVSLKSESYLHIMQLEGYSTNKFEYWIHENKSKIYKKIDIYYLIATISFVILYFAFLNTLIIKSIFYLCINLLLIIMNVIIYSKKEVFKKPLVYTKRAKRLATIIHSLILLDMFIAILIFLIFTNNIYIIYPICVGFMSISYFFCVYYVLLGNLISVPIENRINKKFYDMACKKIRSLDKLKTVGITGSYGKTSTKFITASILSNKFKIMNTPESYNTPMGISKVINNELNDNYEVFIAELGATKKGDIDEVARLTNPKIGVLTSIGPCHLQTFGSIENIANGKYELIEYLPDDGIAIFNYDNPYVRDLADKTLKKKMLYAVENIDNVDVYAKDISVNEIGSVFTLCIKNKGSIKCETSLLGKHNILNILAGVSVATALGMNLEEIRLGIKRILPVKHRLEIIDPKTGILVIDDAFNSNPDGAAAALEVLKEFKNKRKIIVTPGMIELGQIEKKENEKFGEKIAEVCDIVILVGKKRTQPIYEGLVKKGYDSNNIYVVNSTNDSTDIIKNIAKQGDIILYENDLPDNYD